MRCRGTQPIAANLEGLAQAPVTDDDNEPKRALVIAAHPDDADFGAAGTAGLWTREGWEFYYLVCTNGAKGSDDPSMTPERLIALRQGEQRAAAQVLGVKDVFFLDNEDGELVAGRDFLGQVVEVIRKVKPYAVFTHDPEAIIVADAFINHSDHRVTAVTAMDAIYPAARDRFNFPEHIAAGLEPHKVKAIYIWGSERANFDVDITGAIDLKVAALRAHASQFDDDFINMILERWKSDDGRYVESFRRVLMAF